VKQRFHSLDGLRGVCAVTIFLHHLLFLVMTANPIGHGYLAVDAFFVISGFVIAASYEERLMNGMRVGAFLKARIRRLGPTYWFGLILGALAIAVLLIGYKHAPARTALPAILTLLVLESVLIPSFGGRMSSFPLNTPSWSIFAEIVVNVVYARLVAFLRPGVLVAIMVAGWIASACIAWSSPDGWNFGWAGDTILVSTIRAAPAFAAGVLLFRMWRAGRLSALPNVSPLLLVAVWCALAIVPEIAHDVVFDIFVVVFATPLLVACLVRTERRSPAWFSTIGQLSYPLYICQMPILVVAKCVLPFSADLLWNFLLLLPIAGLTVSSAWAMYSSLDPTAARRKPVLPYERLSS
jgi:peptidoglycan/LPS O-acetylase OafA/YrhL